MKEKWMAAQKKLFAQGKLASARRILRGIIDGKATFGLSDVSWDAERALEDQGVRIFCSLDGRYGHAYCRREKISEA